jgi:ribonucleoside-triphosphate reductase
MRVRKYNKKLEDFDKAKIVNSVKLASNATESENVSEFMIKRLADQIEEDLYKQNTNIVDAEKLSDMVENRLMQTSYKEVAKSYITYHYDRQKEHVYQSDLIKAFEKKLNGSNIENSNANCDERSFSGRMNEAARVLLKDNALKTMSKTFRDNHNNNEVYTHDLDSYSSGQHNCLSLPIDNMDREGVHIKQTDIRSAKSVSTFLQLDAVYMQVQSLQQFGGVAYTHLDWSAIPSIRWSFFKHLRDGKKYLKGEDWTVPENCAEISIDEYKDDPCYQYAYDMTVREAHQGAEALIHNLNSLQSRSGQQLPFSSINYGTCTLTEGRMMSHAILDATLDGTGPLHKTPIFPCGIFQYHTEINGLPGTPNYDLFLKALRCTAKRFYPNYTNAQWTNDVAGRMKDVEHKRACLAKLSKEKMAKLANWVKENAKEARHYKMVIDKDVVVIDENIIDPVEIMSTMGCIDANEKITIRQNGTIETLTIGEFYGRLEKLAAKDNAES